MGQGARKAAMLLLSMDPSAATELLKAARPDQVTEIAAELAYLRSAGGVDPHEAVLEFVQMLQNARRSSVDSDLRFMLESALGKEQCQEVLVQVKRLLQAKDPFLAVRNREVGELAAALAGESGSVAALVLNELPPRKASQLLGLLEEPVRLAAIKCMTSVSDVSPEAKVRVAEVVLKRLAMQFGREVISTEERRQRQLRNVALSIRGLKPDLRERTLEALAQQDAAAAKEVRQLMVVWEDMPLIADRTIQEVLRTVDAKQLALSLNGSDEATIAKVRDNISERASEMLEEEMSLLSGARHVEIQTARRAILDSLLELNERGELAMADG
ncbi:MAG: hypothetical protein FWE88_07385 [Phycisphaerae bacterium]|nr:hypothetical protein [Phycisphaerae bacterium]